MRSPNFGERRDGLRPELVVLHYTAMADCSSAARALCDPAREVSAHYLIGRDGAVLPLVDEEKRAWHAGAGDWRGRDNDGLTPFSAPLLAALETLLPPVLAAWGIGPEGVIAHSDMAPGRKIDPGRRFDWRRLALQGLAVWSDARVATVDAERFRKDATAFGYGTMSDQMLLDTVRLRFRPWARGPLAAPDCAVMADLAARYGA